MTFDRHQRWILAQAVAAFVVLSGVWSFQDHILRSLPLPSDTVEDRLALVVQWLLLPGLTLFAGIFAMASGRFFNGATDGSRTPASHGLEINLRYNLNTLEQVVLAAIAWAGLALALPHAQLNLIPLLAILFVVGRAAFWMGYLFHPVARAFGLLLTFAPTCVGYLWLLFRMVKL